MQFKAAKIKDRNGDLTKEWYVEYSYFNEKEGKLIPKREMKGVNSLKTKGARYEKLQLIKKSLDYLLPLGWTPETPIELNGHISPEGKYEEAPKIYSLRDALREAMAERKIEISQTHYKALTSKYEKLLSWIKEFTILLERPAGEFSKKYFSRFLTWLLTQENNRGELFSPRTRNNYLRELSTLFEKMLELELMGQNPAKGIRQIKAPAVKNIPFMPAEVEIMGSWMDGHDPYLKTFIQFMSFTFFRPDEILSLQVRNVNLQDGIIYLPGEHAKVDKSQFVPILDPLKKTLQEMTALGSPADYLFTTRRRPGPKKVYRTDYFSKRFRKVREYMNREHGKDWGVNHTIYGFRHTYISHIYNQVLQEMGRDRAESFMMSLTRHDTRDALRKYLRTINTYMPADWSGKITLKF